MNIIDIAWAAGLYEGEGSVSLNRGHIKVSIPQKDRWSLDRMSELFGGPIHQRSNGMFGWHLSGAQARGFLYSIYIFLSPRRQDQIDPCITGSVPSKGYFCRKGHPFDQVHMVNGVPKNRCGICRRENYRLKKESKNNV